MSKRLVVSNGKMKSLISTKVSYRAMMKTVTKDTRTQVIVAYLKELQKAHCDLPLLPERMNIAKCQKLVGNL